MAQKGPKRQRGPIFFTKIILKTKWKNWAFLNWILSRGRKDTAGDTNANKKLKNIENNSRMPYHSFISTELDLKSNDIEGLDVTF